MHSTRGDVAIGPWLEKQNVAFPPMFYRNIGEPSNAIFAILYRSQRHRVATYLRIDFKKSYKSPNEFEPFSLAHRSMLPFATNDFKPENCNLVNQR